MSLKYRREIDGLRALAVVVVILFHAGLDTFSGGFVGVDIFFVISGYLITSMILVELESGTFSIAKFYERRARRILPALFLVMAVTIPFAYLWLLPNDMRDFSQSLAGVSVFASNLVFWRQSGYFDGAAELKPLLHTWSLAIEEQYYVIFPFVLMLIWRYARRLLIPSLIITTIVSLALADWAAYHTPAANFFLLPTRFWELALGALVAFALAKSGRFGFSSIERQVFSAAGVLMILYAVFGYSSNTPFPGLYALVPTLGTALVILYAHPTTIVGAVLSHRAFVGIGLISYSAYLWHQPLFSFARYRTLEEPRGFLIGVLVTATIALAYLSWKYVEQPFRSSKFLDRKRIFYYSALGSFLMLGIGVSGVLTSGFSSRFENQEHYKELIYRLRGNYGLSQACEKTFTDAVECRTSEKPELLLWGDSYAMHLAQGLLASHPGLEMRQATISQCQPILGLSTAIAIHGARDCIESNDKVLDFLKNSQSVRYVVLASPFTILTEQAPVLLDDGRIVKNGKTIAYDKLIATLEQISSLGITPVIFAPPPQRGSDIGLCLLKAMTFHQSTDVCSFTLATMSNRSRLVYDLLERVSRDYKVIWLHDGICEDGQCDAAAVSGTLIYRDSGHLSHEGSEYLGIKMGFYGMLSSH